jgi:hypothetical protein
MIRLRFILCWTIFLIGFINLIYWLYSPGILVIIYSYIDPMLMAGSILYTVTGLALFYTRKESLKTWQAILLFMCAACILEFQHTIIMESIYSEPTTLTRFLMDIIYGEYDSAGRLIIDQSGGTTIAGVTAQSIPAFTLGYILLAIYFISLCLEIYNFYFSLTVKTFFLMISLAAIMSTFFGMSSFLWHVDSRPKVKVIGAIGMVHISIVLWIDKIANIKKRREIISESLTK